MELRDIIRTKIGNGNEGKLRVSFKKTVNVRQYETEVVETDLEIPISADMTDEKLAVIEEIALAKVEYASFYHLASCGLIGVDAYNDRCEHLKNSVESLANAYGISLDSLDALVDKRTDSIEQ